MSAEASDAAASDVAGACPPGIEVIDDAIADCGSIIDYLDTLPWSRSPVGSPGQTSDIRTSSSVFLPLLSFKNPDVIHELARSVWKHFVVYATVYGITIDEIESMSFNRYEPGQSFDPHTDYFAGSNRVVSAVAYFNTIEAGGHTHFTHLDYSVSAREGRLVMFPSNFLFHHSGTAPETGTKYSAAFWARG
jgi:predicted 2-oxoglutarate/Fe(II)-dependent dioxygenase YbiX